MKFSFKNSNVSFDSNALTVFKSYLNNRQQSVHIGTTESKFNEIKSGVPQGSVLGPILFLLYINDLPLHVKHSQIALFADDTTIHGSSKSLESIEENMQKDLDNINKWCDESKMKINENKTNCMLLGTNQRLANLSKTTLDLKVNDIALDNGKNQKLLHRSKLRNHYYAYPPLALMTQKGVTPNWRRPPFPLNIKYFVPHSTQNLI